MKISYAITVCDEQEEVVRLLNRLQELKRPDDEIVVLLDTPKASIDLKSYLRLLAEKEEISLHKDQFKQDFSEWKNLLTSYCTGEYVFQIDADEIPSESLIRILPDIIQQNADVVLVPRINTVIDITYEHIQKWGWKKDENERINWPDYQWRLYKNVPYIKWINKVHERLDGFKTYALLPAEDDYALIHVKTIERQESQNKFYQSL